MDKTPVYKTIKGYEVCVVPMDEMRQIESRTGRLRTSPSAHFRRLRQLLREKDVDIEHSYLVQHFPDGSAIDYGILVTDKAQIFRFDFDFYGETEAEWHLRMWEDVSAYWPRENWVRLIEIALILVDNDRSR